ncbi:MAG TPA: response regulator transcription factor [Candidatus Angelobacter sp.]
MNIINGNHHSKSASRSGSNGSTEIQLAASSLSKAGPREPVAGRPPVEVYLCSEHPLVQMAMASALESEANTVFATRPAAKSPEYFESSQAPGIAVVDIDSVTNLEDLLLKAVSLSIRPIAVISRGAIEPAEQMRLLGLGVWGVVLVASNFSRELSKAIRAVAGGDLWMNPGILQEYVKQTNALLARLPEAHLLTAREEQVINFLVRNLSNKQIAAFLGISERTVKFHVSNILQKAKVETRRDLIQLTSDPQQVYMAGG